MSKPFPQTHMKGGFLPVLLPLHLLVLQQQLWQQQLLQQDLLLPLLLQLQLFVLN
jgi:hypothetical protein